MRGTSAGGDAGHAVPAQHAVQTSGSTGGSPSGAFVAPSRGVAAMAPCAFLASVANAHALAPG
ncbi:MAG: hypothetical protein WCF30_00045 [Terracidiphilus sp.]